MSYIISNKGIYISEISSVLAITTMGAFVMAEIKRTTENENNA